MKERYFRILDLYKDFCDLCIDDMTFANFTLEEQNDSFIKFINDYDNGTMDNYMSLLFSELSACKDSWSTEELKKFTNCLHCFNLHCKKSIEY